MPITIAIDGPSGAGKSTAAKRVAAALGYTYIDTGAMYRAVAWKSLVKGISLLDTEQITELAARCPVRFETGPDGQRVFICDTDVTREIRTPEVTRLSSPVSAIPGVRKALVARQQEMGSGGGVVMEGRDIGTVVFPHAELKVFLTASEEERAKRRLRDFQARGDSFTLEQVLAQQRERDIRDSSRATSPLKPAPDSVYLDSDNLSIDEVVARILDLARERGA